jgi:hypothetical protein
MTKLLRGSLCSLTGLTLLAACLAGGPTHAADAPPRPPQILLVDEAGWEGAVPANVVAVLESAGSQLLQHVPAAGQPTIAVAARGGPITLFDRTPEGHFQVRLDTGGNLWAQYGFQFCHELCHVLCRSGRTTRTHLWFEEALCETASLFVLRGMADAWEQEPPYPNWRGFAPHLRDYATKRLAQSPRPPQLPLADWYARHRDELRERPTDRDNGLAIAAALLPLFEEDPSRWAAIHWLNASERPQPADFRDHLAAWRSRVPAEQAEAVETIARAFGTPLPPVNGQAGPSGP